MTKTRLFLAFFTFGALASGAVAACATSGSQIEIDASVGDDASSTKDSAVADSGPKTDAGCNSGETKCGSACKNLSNDPQNCGQCGNPCPNGSACEQSSCHLACAPQTRCVVADGGGDAGVELCVDTKTNVSHCGGCNQPCSGPQFCDAGTCDLACADAGTKCAIPDAGTQCVDTTTSNAHCGGCNQPCTNGKTCVSGTCQTVSVTAVQIFPPTGSLQDPGASSVWSARYYNLTFAQAQSITGIDWRANLSSADSIRAEIWDPANQSQVAVGSTVNGGNVQAYYHSNIAFTFQANKPYMVGIYMSNANTVFPRKDSPSYPFNVAGPKGNIAVNSCWSTSTSNTDIYPTASNSWGPDFKLYLQ